MNAETYNAVNDYDQILMDNQVYHITTYKETNNVIIKFISKGYSASDSTYFRSANVQRTKTITLNLPNNESYYAGIPVVSNEPTTCIIDMSLIRRLIIRDFANTTSFNMLDQYTLGYAIRNYITAN